MSVPGLDCSSCAFYQPSFESDAVGQCRRRSPFTHKRSDGSLRTVWPTVSSTMWCGEHATVADPFDRREGESDADYICRLLEAARDRA